jgi:hypothetical protein
MIPLHEVCEKESSYFVMMIMMMVPMMGGLHTQKECIGRMIKN